MTSYESKVIAWTDYDAIEWAYDGFCVERDVFY